MYFVFTYLYPRVRVILWLLLFKSCLCEYGLVAQGIDVQACEIHEK